MVVTNRRACLPASQALASYLPSIAGACLPDFAVTAGLIGSLAGYVLGDWLAGRLVVDPRLCRLARWSLRFDSWLLHGVVVLMFVLVGTIWSSFMARQYSSYLTRHPTIEGEEDKWR